MNAPLAVTLTTEELGELVSRSVAEVVAKLVASQNKEILDLEECAALLKRHPKVVTGVLIKEKGLPVHYISEREPRFKRDEVLAWLNTLPTEPAKSKAP